MRNYFFLEIVLICSLFRHLKYSTSNPSSRFHGNGLCLSKILLYKCPLNTPYFHFDPANISSHVYGLPVVSFRLGYKAHLQFSQSSEESVRERIH